MRSVVVTPAARWEIIAAQDWYESESAGLGARFLAELDHQVQRLATSPHRFPIVRQDIQRCLLRRFPYVLFFRERNDTI